MSRWSRRRVLAGAAGLGFATMACGRPRTAAGPRAPSAPVVTAPSDASEPDAFAALRGRCDGIAAPDALEWSSHRDAVCDRMAAAGIDAVAVEPGAALVYLAGLSWGRSERPLLLILRADRSAFVLCPAFEQRSVAERCAELPLVPWREHDDPFAVALRHAPWLARAQLAIEPSMRAFVVAGMRRACPQAQLRDDDVIGPVRLHKQPAELARLRRANEATQAAIAAVAERVHVGVQESQVAAWMHAALVAAGLTDPWALALVGPNASFPHGSGATRSVAAGDVVLVDTGASLHGYRSDITRTWVVGEPSDALTRAYAAASAAQRAALATIRPGVTAASVDAAARAVMLEAGYGGDDRYFTHRLGHGIGLEVHEPPYLVGGNQQVLAIGMTMSDEPGIYVPGSFGVRTEDIVLVTADGVDVFGELAPPQLDVRPTA